MAAAATDERGSSRAAAWGPSQRQQLQQEPPCVSELPPPDMDTRLSAAAAALAHSSPGGSGRPGDDGGVPQLLRLLANAAAVECTRRRLGAVVAELASRGHATLAVAVAAWLPPQVPCYDGERVRTRRGEGSAAVRPLQQLQQLAAAGATEDSLGGARVTVPLTSWPWTVPVVPAGGGAPTAAAGGGGGAVFFRRHRVASTPGSALASPAAPLLLALQTFIVEGALTTLLGQALLHPGAVVQYALACAIASLPPRRRPQPLVTLADVTMAPSRYYAPFVAGAGPPPAPGTGAADPSAVSPSGPGGGAAGGGGGALSGKGPQQQPPLLSLPARKGERAGGGGGSKGGRAAASAHAGSAAALPAAVASGAAGGGGGAAVDGAYVAPAAAAVGAGDAAGGSARGRLGTATSESSAAMALDTPVDGAVVDERVGGDPAAMMTVAAPPTAEEAEGPQQTLAGAPSLLMQLAAEGHEGVAPGAGDGEDAMDCGLVAGRT